MGGWGWGASRGWLPQIAPALRGGCALLTSKVVGPGGVGVRLGGMGLLIAAFLPRQVVGGHGSQGPRQRQEAHRAPQLRGVQPGWVGCQGHGGTAAGRGMCVGEVLLWRERRGERTLGAWRWSHVCELVANRHDRQGWICIIYSTTTVILD